LNFLPLQVWQQDVRFPRIVTPNSLNTPEN
jgi:hypothetical protein